MKKIALIALLATGLANVAPAAITAGLEAGYLLDNQDAYWAGRVGWEFKTTSNFSHQVELEFGYTEHKESETLPAPGGSFTVEGKTKLTPITINYRAATTVADKLGYYFGAGVGQAKASLDINGSGVPIISDSGNALALQAFAGVNYKATPAVTLHAGVKYLWVDEVELLGAEIEVGDDFALTAGISFRF